MIVVTAGHTDHGKTFLVRKLTGTDTDHLPEEKLRGMTIDIGFASLPLPNGRLVSFVDLPGHHRFVRNMIAGAIGTSFAVLVVACDDGPMPQTYEHLELVEMLGLTRLLVALTKTDIVPAERIASARQAVSKLLAPTRFSDAAIFPVSAVTGQGLNAVRDAIVETAMRPVQCDKSGRFRMSVDRVFTVSGSGLVVTGVVHSGSASLGDTVIVSPLGLSARIRGIQEHGVDALQAGAGGRFSLNLRGPKLKKNGLRRGAWILDPVLHAPTRVIDIELSAVRAVTADARKGIRVHAHVGTDNVTGRLWPIETSGEGRQLLHVKFDRSVATLYGDCVIFRDHSGSVTLSGGRVIDPFAPERGWRTPDRITTLRGCTIDDWRTALQCLLKLQPVDIWKFALSRNLECGQVGAEAAMLKATLINSGRTAIGKALAADMTAALANALAEYHAAHPREFGIAMQRLARKTGHAEWSHAVAHVVASMRSRGEIVARGGLLRLERHSPHLSHRAQKEWQQVRARLNAAGLRPPSSAELAADLEWKAEKLEAVCAGAEQRGLAMAVPPARYYLVSTLLDLANIARTIALENEDGTFTVAQFNRRTAIGRNVSVALLEFFDRIGLTRRGENVRIFVSEPRSVFQLNTVESEIGEAEQVFRKRNASGDARGLQTR